MPEFSRLNIRLFPVQLGILVTFALAPAWFKFQDAPAPFTATYILGFVIVVPMILTILVWILAGLPGLADLLRDQWRFAWVICLLLLAAWGFFSQGWAFIQEKEPGVGQNFALQLWLIVLFLVATASAAPPLRLLIGIFIISTLMNSLIGRMQVATQGSIGLEMLGEFTLDPAKSGTSVIQSGGIRWLRPYGLLPHPNVYAGMLIMGLFSAAAWSIGQNFLRRFVGTAAFLAGLWMLLLTFSRSAWLGFGVGMVAILPLVFRFLQINNSGRDISRPYKTIIRLLPLLSLSVFTGIVFLLMYHPFVLARAGAGQENTEMRSIADRIVYTDIAWLAIQEQPITGVGGGNFPWYASYYLHYNTNYDLRGDNVHNVALLVWSELGLVGLTLFGLMLLFGMLAAYQNMRHSGYTPSRIALLGAVIALFVVGFFDHYPVSLIHGQVVWLGLLAIALSTGEKISVSQFDVAPQNE